VLRGAGAVAGEVEADQAVDAGAGRQVVAGEAMQAVVAGKALADERALFRLLLGMAAGIAKAVSGGEDEGWRRGPGRGCEDLGEVGLSGVLSQERPGGEASSRG